MAIIGNGWPVFSEQLRAAMRSVTLRVFMDFLTICRSLGKCSMRGLLDLLRLPGERDIRDNVASWNRAPRETN